MFKKLILVVSIALILTGCSIQNVMKKYILEEKDTEVNDRIIEVNVQTTEVNDRTTEDYTEDTESIDKDTIELNEDDFKVYVRGITIEVGDDSQEMIDTLENGPDSMDCILTYVGTDSELENHYYCRIYEGFSVYTMVNIVSGESIISQINISATKRGIKIGDSFKDLIEKYGTPNDEMIVGDTHYVYYFYKDKKLSFTIEDDTINNIRISMK